ncbi:MAG: Rne/Rng family ribonuclease [Actinobacteria bacterium]|nr:Rne/Rng family ribonuclease [Actinomycetota bacterium]
MSESAPRKREKASETQAVDGAPVEEPPKDSAKEPVAARRSRRRGNRRRTRRSSETVERVMLVHGDRDSTQIAVLEQGRIVEHYVAGMKERSIVGSIYLGRVQNVLPGMEAAFVDIGEGRNGVLYSSEVGLAGEEGDEIPRIETVLRSDQPIIVQVTKDPMRSKGARLTAMASIAGRHLVLVPGGDSVGVSRRLTDGERERLRPIATRLRPEGNGIIVRTAAEGAAEDDLERDLARLLATWSSLAETAKKSTAPALLYREPELELRVFRDLFNREVVRCVVDDPTLEAKLRSYIHATAPDLEQRLELYEGVLPIFEEFRVLEQIRKSLDRKVWLPSGGHLVIDRTEAMTVVDVNTGKYVGKSHLEETVFRTNKEAAVEIGRQLRLRDIGGIIVIDFIDMEDPENRAELEKVFRDVLERDRTRTQAFELTPLGLMQLTRKNVSAGIVEAFSNPCPTCEGRGIIIHDVD